MKSRKWLIFFGVTLVLGVNIWIYRPILNAPIFDGDQIDYFAEMNGAQSLRRGLALADYSLTRRFGTAGDELIYRPLLFAWLAVQHRTFSYHHRHWNAMVLALHLAVGLLFFRLLWRIHSGWPAVFFCLWFSTSYHLTFILIRSGHTGGYLWAVGLVLTGLLCLHRIFLDEIFRKRWVLGYVASGILAGFFHEIAMIVLMVVAVGSCGRMGNRPQKVRPERWLWILTPGIVYAIVFFLRFLEVRPLFFGQEGDAAVWFSAPWLQAFPVALGAYFKAWGVKILNPITPWSVILKMVLGFIFLRLLSWKDLPRRTFPLLAIPSALGLYASVLCFIRRPPFEYYDYFFLLLTLLFIYGVADWSRLSGKLKWVAVAAGAVFLLQNAIFTHQYLGPRIWGGEEERYFDSLVAFVDARKQEKDFSFRVLNPPVGFDTLRTLDYRKPVSGQPRDIEKYWSEIIFQPYWRWTGAKYDLVWENNRLSVRPLNRGVV